MSPAAAHEQIFCSFCGKSQHDVGSLIEGGCRNPALSQCVFICDECVALSAQVLADTARDASPKSVSGG
jgi:ATP-dependent Clp protease ATP-binding subunit ClpX